MAIRITRTDEQFHVQVTPPQGDWRSTAALSTTEVIDALAQIGCHQTDVIDALDASGADWRPAHDAEVLRRRQVDGWSS